MVPQIVFEVILAQRAAEPGTGSTCQQHVELTNLEPRERQQGFGFKAPQVGLVNGNSNVSFVGLIALQIPVARTRLAFLSIDCQKWLEGRMRPEAVAHAACARKEVYEPERCRHFLHSISITTPARHAIEESTQNSRFFLGRRSGLTFRTPTRRHVCELRSRFQRSGSFRWRRLKREGPAARCGGRELAVRVQDGRLFVDTPAGLKSQAPRVVPSRCGVGHRPDECNAPTETEPSLYGRKRPTIDCRFTASLPSRSTGPQARTRVKLRPECQRSWTCGTGTTLGHLAISSLTTSAIGPAALVAELTTVIAPTSPILETSSRKISTCRVGVTASPFGSASVSTDRRRREPRAGDNRRVSCRRRG